MKTTKHKGEEYKVIEARTNGGEFVELITIIAVNKDGGVAKIIKLKHFNYKSAGSTELDIDETSLCNHDLKNILEM